MFAVIQDCNGSEQARYALADTDLLDCDIYAARYAHEIGVEVSVEDGEIPDGVEDFSVTLTEEPGRPRCWTSKNYFFGH